MGIFDFIHRTFPPAHPNAPPPSYQDVAAPRSWKVHLKFGSDPDLLKRATPQVNLTIGWQAHLILYTSDIVGLMREGLYVSQKNVIVEESCLALRPHEQEHKTYYHDRHFALTSPNWKGNLVVTTFSGPIATNFRVEHLSADKVFHCDASDVSKTPQCWAYYFMINRPHVNANYILDDTPLEGLWPWPRNEPSPQGMEKEREQEGTEEGDMLDLL
ncbi:hypothetical protein BFJ72_g2350 [Fusarium proliferatum]|uniref:Uncharacterized protein n=1 Tax=Gibberella intermedia TaxID=948311 RepID=A0A420U0S2_GIBIN|nr:hypothetical protein FPRO03_09597 [Fusarium proliferatum]RKL47359.1 hypothetical protein BFJ72_g2350 [Fusarium proliferatum]